MLNIDKTKPVLVTGATGYVAGWIVKRLLEEGVTVHATVRNPADAAKLAHLNRLAAELPGTIHYFKADLLDQGAYAQAMRGCAIVFHTASPFKLDIADPQKNLVDPAVLGTRNVLQTANRTDSVRRVVLTSSCAAIYGDCADVEDTAGKVLTEDVWNTSSSLSHVPYSYSKTVAERAAWDIVKQQGRWDLVVVNPSLVLGPGLNPEATSESFNLLRQLGDGRMKSGMPDIGCGAVDVRDVAEAHLRAAYLPGAKGRHIISGHDTSLPGLAEVLRLKYAARTIRIERGLRPADLCLPAGRYSVEDIGKSLALSTRTLQRQLRDEATTFTDLLNATRRQLAQHYLSTSSVSHGEIAFLLGFQEVNSFLRAFKDWTGITPGTYRQEIALKR